MNTKKKSANVIGAKTARACESWVKKRAHSYCTADDAFLCQNCDSSIHSANPLAQRHKRVRLETSSLKPTGDSSPENCVPAWYQGFTRKARTPRIAKLFKAEKQKMANPLPLVPELGSDETSMDENEELLYRVPIFDPFLSEFCTTPASESAMMNVISELNVNSACNVDNLSGFFQSDMDVAEFDDDVENLLGRGFIDDESFSMEGLGLLNPKEEDANTNNSSLNIKFSCLGNLRLKVERQEEEKVDISKWMSLRLDYEAVISSWADQGSPWMTGDSPELNPVDCWPDYTGMCCIDVQQAYRDVGGHGVERDRGREARVLRYREKRRTRLFSKKIRYEVRKLNAENRPRMKGRFVKRM